MMALDLGLLVLTKVQSLENDYYDGMVGYDHFDDDLDDRGGVA